jgi:hypothetical protein
LRFGSGVYASEKKFAWEASRLPRHDGAKPVKPLNCCDITRMNRVISEGGQGTFC